MVDEQLRVTTHDYRYLTEIRRPRNRLTVENGTQFGKEPRTSETAAADDDAVATGLFHHRDRVGGVENIAVPQDGDGCHVILERGDLAPVGGARVAL